MAENKTEKISFKNTLNLPQTSFPIRPNAKIDDVALIERWEKEDLFAKSFAHNSGAKKYIFHDGPPYANGHIHIGHAYNKILKDIVTKAHRMLGLHVPVVPGWDCHGLPIELKVTQENPELKGAELKKACRASAQKWIDIQKGEFKRLGILMDWDNPYITMDFAYEASIVRAFGEFVEKGYIERKNKTVPWCPSCQTVLASAEIEYHERKDPSIYVLFTLGQSFTDTLIPALAGKPVSLIAWTTTPWTIPLNRAVLLKPTTAYVVLEVNGQYVALGKELADALCTAMETDKKVVAEFVSDDLVALQAYVKHPIIEGRTSPVLLDQSVLTQEGTACVHSAPGAGPEDYEIGVKNNLEIYSPVGPDGAYTAEIEPRELEGIKVQDAQGWVIKTLLANNKLLHKTSIRHSYPHCWRCRGGLIFRATKQWFCDLEKHDLKKRVIEAIETIATVPEKSINRLRATVEGRLEWCLSRQRAWGTPIPALLCTQCDYTHVTPELIKTVSKGIEKQGVEFWDTVTIDQLIPQDFTCPKCKSKSFIKEQDILDVWFDSGVSHRAVLDARESQAYPADVYIEGQDQHRGWFQSSLLTSMVLNGKPSMKTIITHGFTVDAKGRKMSKSVGNVVSPQELIDVLGTDGVRLWTSSIDTSGDAVISDVLTKNVQEVFRKIRNTCRFLLSNIYDFDKAKDGVALDELQLIDQHALHKLCQLQHEILQGYVRHDFTAVFHRLGEYCSSDLRPLVHRGS